MQILQFFVICLNIEEETLKRRQSHEAEELALASEG